jgi:hypothetical protein
VRVILLVGFVVIQTLVYRTAVTASFTVVRLKERLNEDRMLRPLYELMCP